LKTTEAFAAAISAFGALTKAKLSNRAASGSPEDQLRAPLEALTHDLAILASFPDGAVDMVGESSLSELKTRPDYAVVVHNALVGFVEVKAPGKGADPRRFSDPHDKAQWDKLRSLPNLLYTDGNAFSLWRDGKLQGSVVRLEGDVEKSGTALAAPPSLVTLFTDFLNWQPIPPRTAKQLAHVSARLCRLLREEVVEQMDLGSVALTELAKDWRILLFPQASDAEFADGYAQAVTFGLLVARARNISLASGIDHAAQELRQTNSLIGTALRLLTDDSANQAVLKTSLGTLTRVLEAVDWSKSAKAVRTLGFISTKSFLRSMTTRSGNAPAHITRPQKSLARWSASWMMSFAARAYLIRQRASLQLMLQSRTLPSAPARSCSVFSARSRLPWRRTKAPARSRQRFRLPPGGSSDSSCNSAHSQWHNCASSRRCMHLFQARFLISDSMSPTPSATHMLRKSGCRKFFNQSHDPGGTRMPSSAANRSQWSSATRRTKRRPRDEGAGSRLAATVVRPP
jgi:hypothetical protein